MGGTRPSPSPRPSSTRCCGSSPRNAEVRRRRDQVTSSNRRFRAVLSGAEPQTPAGGQAPLDPPKAVVPRRIAVLSVHTSPLEQPGTGDAGGMNVYVSQTAPEMARRGVEVEVFTRATASDQPPVAELAPGVTVRHVQAGPFE